MGVNGPNKNKNKKDVGLPMTMPQAAGKNLVLLAIEAQRGRGENH